MNDIERLHQARENVIEALSENMILYGVTPSIGRLYGAMFFKNEPMTLDEMKEELGMSKTSMSTAVRTLLDLKLVERVWKKGSRKDLYQIEEDWHQNFIDFFCIKWRRGISLNISAIHKTVGLLKELVDKEEVDPEARKEALLDIDKLNRTLDYYDWLNRLVDSFESGEIFKFIPKNAD